MTPRRRTRQRGRPLDDRDGTNPRLHDTRSGGPPAAATPPPVATATPARRTSYADAATRPRANPASSTPVTLLSPLQGTPSLRPRTSLRPLALPAWQPKWDDDDTAVDDDTLDDVSDVGGTEETKDKDFLVDDASILVDRDTATVDTPDGDDSPPLLSLPPSPEPVMLGASAFTPITIPDDGNPMAALNRGISAHLVELDHQQRAIGDKYDAFCALLVQAKASFDTPAIDLRIRSAIGAHTAPFSELISQAESAIDIRPPRRLEVDDCFGLDSS